MRYKRVVVDVPVALELPMVPNHFRLTGERGTIPVHELTDAQLRRIGEEWTAALLEHARRGRQHVASRSPKR